MLTIKVEPNVEGSGVAVMALEGELDAASYLDVIERTRQLTGAGTRGLVLDLSALSYMGSSGLFALHSMAMLLRGRTPPDPEQGYAALHEADDIQGPVAELKLVGPQAQVDRVLERTGLKQFFEVHPDRQSALASF